MAGDPYWRSDDVTLYHGKAEDVLGGLDAESVDAVVCDPPYGLSEITPRMVTQAVTAWTSGDRLHIPDARGFMGRAWDAFVPPPGLWDQVYRVLKPGGHVLAFAGTRTMDLMTLSIRLAGFEIRDVVADLTGQDAPGLVWAYGSGFPKGIDVSKAIDRAAGAEREVIGANPLAGNQTPKRGTAALTAPATDGARKWEGWNTALKPAWEPIVAARKPLVGAVAANVLQYGTGALHVNLCRVGSDVRVNPPAGNKPGGTALNMSMRGMPQDVDGQEAVGRWPTNLVLVHSVECEDGGWCAAGCPVAELDQQSGIRTSGAYPTQRGSDKFSDVFGTFGGQAEVDPVRANDTGGASRFFPVFRYSAKASRAERPRLADGTAWVTVKPVKLMCWLVRLVTRPGGLVLDPFAGSGTTAEACLIEGMRCVLVDADPAAVELVKARLSKAIQPGLFGV